MPQDILQNEINVGDTVVFGMAQHMNLLKGVVTKINAKTVKIEHVEWNHWCKRYDTVEAQRTFDNVVVVKND